MKSFAPQLLWSQILQSCWKSPKGPLWPWRPTWIWLVKRVGAPNITDINLGHGVMCIVTSKDGVCLGLALHSSFESWRSPCDGAAVLQLCFYKSRHSAAKWRCTIWSNFGSSCGSWKFVPGHNASLSTTMLPASKTCLVCMRACTLNSEAAMSMPDTSFSSQCPWCILDTGTTRQFLYALFPGPEHAVCHHQPQCDALPRACFLLLGTLIQTWIHVGIYMAQCYIELSWMGSWGHTCAKPSVAWGTMLGT